MAKVAEYKAILVGCADWDSYLLKESGLPGPRGNLELAQAVADLGDAHLFARYASLGEAEAPENTPQVFLAFCGVLGLGRLLAESQTSALGLLRAHASDPRWRIREAVAMALQRYGDHDVDALLAEMGHWATGGRLEQRAAIAALCEPRLLRQAQHVRQVLAILDQVTATVPQAEDRAKSSFQSLCKSLGYCWSVAVVASPGVGKPALERWLVCEDRDVRRIMKENLRKSRLARMDPEWTAHWQSQLGPRTGA